MRLHRLFIGLLFLLHSVIGAHAATFTVTNTADAGTGGCTLAGTGDGCSLREAIAAANNVAGADTIDFDIPGAGPHIIQLASTLTLSSDVSISAPTDEKISVLGTGTANFDIFTVNPGVNGDFLRLIMVNGASAVKSLNNSVLTMANCTLGSSHFGLYNSGSATLTSCVTNGNQIGVNNFGSVTLTACDISANSSSGILTSGSATLSDCSISNNIVGVNGGATLTNCTVSSNQFGVSGSQSLTNCTLSDNTTGVNNNGSSTLTNCTVSSNSTGIVKNSGTLLHLKNCIVAGNTSTNQSGSGALDDSGGNFLSGDPQLNPLANNGGPTRTMLPKSSSPVLDAALSDGAPSTDQRGLPRPVDISQYANAVGGDGGDIGAVELQVSGTLQTGSPSFVVNSSADITTDDGACTLEDCNLREAVNAANAKAGADVISFDLPGAGPHTIQLASALLLASDINLSGPTGEAVTVRGGGTSSFIIFGISGGANATFSHLTISNGNDGIRVNNSSLTLNACTFTGNVNGVYTQFGATLAMTNCTFNGNATNGVFNRDSGTVTTATNCTLSGNAHGIANTEGATLDLLNTIVAGNTIDNVSNTGTVTVNDNGGNFLSGDPQLNPLADNGGPTQTMLPQSGSPVLDTALSAGAPPADQRGFLRPSGSGIDIGAVEVGSATSLPSLTISNATVLEGNAGSVNATFTVTLSEALTTTVTVDYGTTNGTTNPATAGSDYTATSGTLTFTSGQTTHTITVPVLSDVLDENNETFFVNLSNATNATIADNQGLGTIIDNDTPPSLSINDVTLSEGSAPATAIFTVSLSMVSGKTVTVQYATNVPGSFAATPGEDYLAVPLTTLTFSPGETSKQISVQLNDDTRDEINERFAINLSSAVNATIADKEGFCTILDDDAPPSVSVNNVTVSEGNTDTTPATFTVSLSAASGKTVTVQCATNTPGSYPATPGTDYVALPTTTLTFAPGETSKAVTVAVNGDLLDEDNERLTLNLKNAGNATIADKEGFCTVTDDDAPPSLSINDVSLAEGNSGTTAFTFTVTLSAASGKTVTVKYATANPSSIPATAGTDYTALPLTTLAFAPGQTSKTITVFVNGDTQVEGTERFAVKLSVAASATIADSEGFGTIINDDVAALLNGDDAPSE